MANEQRMSILACSVCLHFWLLCSGIPKKKCIRLFSPFAWFAIRNTTSVLWKALDFFLQINMGSGFITPVLYLLSFSIHYLYIFLENCQQIIKNLQWFDPPGPPAPEGRILELFHREPARSVHQPLSMWPCASQIPALPLTNRHHFEKWCRLLELLILKWFAVLLRSNVIKDYIMLANIIAVF